MSKSKRTVSLVYFPPWKQGKEECLYNPIDKGDTPFDTFHVDYLGPLHSTGKGYKYVFAVMDEFTKFAWLYPVKTTSSKEIIEKLKNLIGNFETPKRIISDKGTAFTSNEFKEFCKEERINHIVITTGVPRGNGQIERLNRVILSVISKLSVEKPVI